MRACGEAWTALHPEIEVAWEFRPLAAFGDEPLEEVASRYDLVMIDHPFSGTAAATGLLLPLESLLPAGRLAELAGDSMGPSHDSYRFGDRQWALATDAACQVSAVRDDLLGADATPATWDDVRELARSRPGRVAVPLAPAQAICAFLTLCANAGTPAAEDHSALVDTRTGRAAIDLLAEIYRLGPSAASEWEQPDVLDRLTGSDELVYVPIVFGFVTYSRTDRVRTPCRFANLPSSGKGPVGAILGGAGLAVSAATEHPSEAAAFLSFAADARTQREVVARVGGQPGSRSAWSDPEVDRAAGGFFSSTAETLEQAWVRPRDPWWPAFQRQAGPLVSNGLAEGEPSDRLFDALESLYRRCRSGDALGSGAPVAGQV
jgi:multiple sugar transport system substrate-binding protein